MLAAIRIRGSVGLNPMHRKTLGLLRLFRVNHLALVGEKDRGMLEKSQGFVTWGEIDAPTMAMLLEKRARLPGNKAVGKETLEKMKMKSFEELAKGIVDGKISLEEAGVKPVIRLNSPRKGFERGGKKKPFLVGGALGYRAGDINALIKKMA